MPKNDPRQRIEMRFPLDSYEVVKHGNITKDQFMDLGNSIIECVRSNAGPVSADVYLIIGETKDGFRPDERYLGRIVYPLDISGHTAFEHGVSSINVKLMGSRMCVDCSNSSPLNGPYRLYLAAYKVNLFQDSIDEPAKDQDDDVDKNMNKIIESLNLAYKMSPSAIHCIAANAVPCTIELLNDHPDVECRPGRSTVTGCDPILDAIGLLNGVLRSIGLPGVELSWKKDDNGSFELEGFKRRES